MTTGLINTFYARTLDLQPKYPKLEADIETDVCVIGGGLAGMNTALGLLERGKNIVLIEAKRIGWGASGRNAGFVAKGYSAGEAGLAKSLGLEHAQKLVSLTKNARKLIRNRIEEFNIDCGPVIDGVLTVSWRDKPDEVKKYVEQANKNFDLGFEFWDRERVRDHCKTERYFDGVYSPHDFQFNPLRYLLGLSDVVLKKGGLIFEHTPAINIQREGAEWIVYTTQGKVKAQHVVVCCSIYVDKLNKKLANSVFPVKTYIMVTAAIDEVILKSAINTRHAIYDMRFCSDYYRRLEGNRILWGGRVSLYASPKDISCAMLEDMLKVYPQLRGHVVPDVSWSGELAYAPHKMPQIGQFEEGYWYNTGFGGHGLCPTTAGGEVVAAAIAANDQTYRSFAPFKPIFVGGKLGRYAAQMVYLWWRARDYLDI